MAIGRGRSHGRFDTPYDQAMLWAMAFFITLAAFYVVMAIWGFGLQSGLRFL
jgi:hypothetical protein